jgi:hypothetical protein
MAKKQEWLNAVAFAGQNKWSFNEELRAYRQVSRAPKWILTEESAGVE